MAAADLHSYFCLPRHLCNLQSRQRHQIDPAASAVAKPVPAMGIKQVLPKPIAKMGLARAIRRLLTTEASG